MATAQNTAAFTFPVPTGTQQDPTQMSLMTAATGGTEIYRDALDADVAPPTDRSKRGVCCEQVDRRNPQRQRHHGRRYPGASRAYLMGRSTFGCCRPAMPSSAATDTRESRGRSIHGPSPRRSGGLGHG